MISLASLQTTAERLMAKAAIEIPEDYLDALERELMATGVAGADRAFNLTWHDWLNLRSLVEISKVIALAALTRTNSRGAHYRDDFPEEGDLAASTFTVARRRNGRVEMTDEPVQFTIVRPGATILKAPAEEFVR